MLQNKNTFIQLQIVSVFRIKIIMHNLERIKTNLAENLYLFNKIGGESLFIEEMLEFFDFCMSSFEYCC